MDVSLSALGKQEAHAAAAQLVGEGVDHVFASPLRRALFGAECVASTHGLEVEVCPEFREIDRGRWSGKTKEEIQETWPRDLVAHEEDLEQWREHGGESLGDLRTRVLKRVLSWPEPFAGKHVVMVSHLFPTRAVLAAVLDLPLNGWGALRLPTGSVSRVDWSRPDMPELVWAGRPPFTEGNRA